MSRLAERRELKERKTTEFCAWYFVLATLFEKHQLASSAQVPSANKVLSTKFKAGLLAVEVFTTTNDKWKMVFVSPGVLFLSSTYRQPEDSR
jgi:hypothetical protein